jgi:hypothetical protein
MFRKLIGAVVGLALAGMVTAAQVPVVNAATYNWTFECLGWETGSDGTGDCSGSGELTTDAPIGPATVTSISGSLAGVEIFALSNYFPTDNLIVSLDQPHFSSSGEYYSGILFNTLPFTMSSAITNIWYDQSTGHHRVTSYYNNLNGAFGTFSVAPIPIPAALPLFATALAGMGFVGWRRRRQAA